MTFLPSPPLALALLLALLVISHDLYARRVPNTVLLGTLIVAGVWQMAGWFGWVPITTPHLAEGGLALVVGLVAMLPFYAIGWMGAGDVKLMAVLGFLLGLKPLFIVWVLGNALVGAHALLVVAMRLAIRRQPQLAILQTGWQRSAIYQRIRQPRQGREGLPFAAYLGIGVFVYVFCAPWLGVPA